MARRREGAARARHEGAGHRGRRVGNDAGRDHAPRHLSERERRAAWVLKEDNLPIHLEAGPLARDPTDPGLIYAVYSLMPYSEVWRAANEGGNLLARMDPISLAGGISFFLLVLLGGGFVAFKLAGARSARSVTPSAPQ